MLRTLRPANFHTFTYKRIQSIIGRIAKVQSHGITPETLLKRIAALAILAALLGTALGGCIVVPDDGGGYHHHHHDEDYR